MFELVAGDGTDKHGGVRPQRVRTTEYGRLLAEAQGRAKPFSDETVRNYVKKKKITPVERDDKGRMLFDPASAEEDAQRLPKPTRGGERAGAGRPSKETEPGPLELAAERNKNARETVERYQDEERRVDEGTLDPGDPMRSRTHLDELVGFSVQELEMLASSEIVNSGSAELTPAKLSNFHNLLKARELKLKIAREEGRLVEVSVIERAWSAVLAMVRNDLERIPAAVAGPVAEAAWVPPETIDEVCSMLHKDGVEDDTVDCVRRLLTRPIELTARITSLIERSVETSRRAMAESKPPEIKP